MPPLVLAAERLAARKMAQNAEAGAVNAARSKQLLIGWPTMVTTAFVFDTMQIGPKIAYLLAATPAWFASWLPFWGDDIAASIYELAITFDVAISMPTSVLGYAIMALWLTMRGVKLWSGNNIGWKIFFTLILVTFGLMPILSAFFDITIWTLLYIFWFTKHDGEASGMPYNESEIDVRNIRRQALREEALNNS